MSTLTPNYSFILPGVGDPVDEDLWGFEWNDNWTSVDTILPTLSPNGYGSIVVQNATDNGLTLLGQGTSGYGLISAGADALPVWTDIVIDSPWVHIETQIASTSADIEFTSVFSATYTKYCLFIEDVVPETDNTTLEMYLSQDNGSTYYNSYSYSGYYNQSNTTTISGYGASGQPNIPAASNCGDGTGESVSGLIWMLNPLSTTFYKSFRFEMGQHTEASAVLRNYYFAGGTETDASAITAFKFQMSADTIASGTFTLYGIKE